jgi:cell wall-associated NlpC family hydrolase
MDSARRAIAALMCASACAGLAACGATTSDGGSSDHARTAPADAVAGTIVGSPTKGASATASTASTAPHGTVREIADPKEADSFPAPASVHHASAATPVKAGAALVASGAPSDAEVRGELAQMKAAERSAKETQRHSLIPVPGGESVGGDGTIPIPTNVPESIQKVVAGANEIADFPYVFGGGHASFVDNAYDCSGSVSYALAAGGLLSAPETSGELESWGVAGPGKYITVYANAGHTYMYVDGILYDTAGRSGVYASRWLVAPTDNSGFVARHWPGL